MAEQHRSVCSSCGCPTEAGHAKDCQLNREEQNGWEYSFSDLLAELEKAGFDKDKISDICREENLVGHGGNADVYKIPNVEKYVLRVVRWKRGGGEVGKIEEVKDELPELNVGQAVAKMSGAEIYFLKKQRGIPAGVPHGKMRREGENADPIYEEHLKRAAEIPQSAYDEFARILVAINARGYNFDPSKANNVLLDAEKGEFNLVDVNKRSENSAYKNEMADMVIVLMDNSYAWRYKGTAPVEDYRKTILGKCIEAGKKVGLHLPEAGKNSSLDYSFKLAGQERMES